MKRPLVLDAEALSRLATGRHQERARAAIEAARRLDRDVVVAAVTLAELYRGRARSQAIDACLAREALRVRDTDQELARYVGAVLDEAGADSSDLADAHAVAVAAELGGGTLLTGDVDDLRRLAAPYPLVVVASV